MTQTAEKDPSPLQPHLPWQEEVNPRVVVELISPGTEKEDLGETLRRADKPPTKWEVYEANFRHSLLLRLQPLHRGDEGFPTCGGEV